MFITEENFKEMLVAPGHVTDGQFLQVVKDAAAHKVPLQEAFVESGLISDENLGRTIADFYDAHFMPPDEIAIKDEYLTYIPEAVVRAQRAIVCGVDHDEILLATEDFGNYPFFKLLEKKAGKRVTVYYTTSRGIDRALKFYKGDLHASIMKLAATALDHQEEGDVVELVNLMLEYAHDNRASDIHLEPLEHDILVRFRVDGILHEAFRYPSTLHEKIAFRIKILAHMQTDEHAAAQDGRFTFQTEGVDLDVRVSVLPITDGENIVMRLLDSHTHKFTLENLGLSDDNYKKILKAIEKPHGMILAVGPTGSGKTTVLYTILEKLNSSEVNIMTVEDPVEYDIDGVQQTQVNQKKDLTFANGLRSIVRQDPDIIMVGEIRDEETADIAVNSALTGHLVISTLHTNDAATTFPRLAEMKVEPFLVASSVNIIIALRLVRKICERCKESYVPTTEEAELIKLDADTLGRIRAATGAGALTDVRLYRGRGCKACRDTGYSGRVGIFEILEVTPEIQVLITKEASADEINTRALNEGMTSLLSDGIQKVLAGVTTLEEVIKVART